ncbi:MAG: polysaccharide export protein, partial [Prevotella sp.]|nr:polysaccharide export protein [Prevotella sp.]
MKKFIIFSLMLFMVSSMAMAQSSSMTDDQVMSFVVKEHNSGTSNSQIVTKLMQRGVDISQIRRVRARYEREAKQGGLENASGKASATPSRLRANNGKTREDYAKNTNPSTSTPNATHQDVTNRSNYRVSAESTDNSDKDEYMAIQNEMSSMYPDIEPQKKSFKVFGRDIFNNKSLTFEPNMNIATPQNYRLGPGDAVIIDIYGASQKTIQDTVSPDGTVTIEGYGPVSISGLTVSQANARLRGTVGSRYSSSKIRLTVGQTKTIMVNVMGEVKAPGTYTLSAFATVFHALYMAGGINDLGTLRNIKVYRNNRLVTVVDIYDYILNGKLTGNVRLADNDVIVVGPYDCLVNITGKVKRPMFYEMKKNESINSLLKYAGSFTGDAYKKSVRVNRKTGREYSVYNVEEFDFASFR